MTSDAWMLIERESEVLLGVDVIVVKLCSVSKISEGNAIVQEFVFD